MCGRMKGRPHPQDRCANDHPSLPLRPDFVTLQPHRPDADLPEFVRRVRWLLTVEDAPIPELSKASLVRQLNKALEDCDPNNDFPMREA